MPNSLPVIDISALFDDDAAATAQLARDWDATLQRVGFAVIVGHHVPAEVCDTVYAEARKFFDLPADEKLKAKISDTYGTGGYFGKGVEAVGRSWGDKKGHADLIENIAIFGEAQEPAAAIAALPPSLVSAMRAYWAALRQLALKLMELCAISLGLTADYFVEYYAQPSLFLKLSNYPAPAPEERAQLRYGAHTDFQGLTILMQDPLYTARNGGLEVLFPAGQWVPCPRVERSFVVNVGDVLQQWTNDRWLSNVHRVAPCGEDEDVPARLSVVFFTGPSDDTVISALPTCVGSGAKHPPITAIEHLRAKLTAANAPK